MALAVIMANVRVSRKPGISMIFPESMLIRINIESTEIKAFENSGAAKSARDGSLYIRRSGATVFYYVNSRNLLTWRPCAASKRAAARVHHEARARSAHQPLRPSAPRQAPEQVAPKAA